MDCIQVVTSVALTVWGVAILATWATENKEHRGLFMFVRFTAFAVAMVLIIIQNVGVAKVAERIDRMFP